ncbi:MAG: pantoate--beta-alanine ligase [Actinobacteria bacterium]|nr:pantoate--beta-alanine ligase [Actinomycetota bacterium]
MKIVRTTAEIRVLVADARRKNLSVGLVPTMGALHDGHLSHVRRAREENGLVVVSIFVNPLQFGPSEDLDAYPRDEAGDTRLLAGEGADLVFAPATEEVHPHDRATTVTVGGLSEVLEGARRPGHFDGVCTVVAKLLNIVAPDRVYFGQKDAQQVAVLGRMVQDLGFPVEMVVGPIVRESNGLAMSSRNAYLSSEERKRATALFKALQAGSPFAAAGDFAGASNEMLRVLRSATGVEPDYATAVDADSFGPPEPGGRILLVVAARVGPARLIDNLLVEVENT